MLDCMLIVSTLTSDALNMDVMYRSCKLEVAGRELEANLILLDISDFNVILGIDWLVAHHAHVNCFRTIVMFKIPNKKPFSI